VVEEVGREEKGEGGDTGKKRVQIVSRCCRMEDEEEDEREDEVACFRLRALRFCAEGRKEKGREGGKEGGREGGRERGRERSLCESSSTST